jgi:hypothetical protein
MLGFTPTREDRFTFGLWTSDGRGWMSSAQPSAHPLTPPRRCTGWPSWAYGVTFHDNDVFPFGSGPAAVGGTKRARGTRRKAARTRRSPIPSARRARTRSSGDPRCPAGTATSLTLVRPSDPDGLQGANRLAG